MRQKLRAPRSSDCTYFLPILIKIQPLWLWATYMARCNVIDNFRIVFKGRRTNFDNVITLMNIVYKVEMMMNYRHKTAASFPRTMWRLLDYPIDNLNIIKCHFNNSNNNLFAKKLGSTFLSNDERGEEQQERFDYIETEKTVSFLSLEAKIVIKKSS